MFDSITKPFKDAAVAGVKDMLLQFLASHGLTIVLGLLAVMAIWAAITAVAKKFAGLTVAAAVMLAAGAILALPGAAPPPPPDRTLENIGKAVGKAMDGLADLGAKAADAAAANLAVLRDNFAELREKAREKLSQFDLSGFVKEVVAFVEKSVWRYPDESDLLARKERLEEETRQRLEKQRLNRQLGWARLQNARVGYSSAMAVGMGQLREKQARVKKGQEEAFNQSQSPPRTFPGPIVFPRKR